jgi:hypothetical protein
MARSRRSTTRHDSIASGQEFDTPAQSSAKMTDVSETGEDSVQLTPRWPLDAASQAQIVNQVVCAWDQGNRDTMYLVLGHIPPPLWLRQEDAMKFAAENDAIDVQPRGSFVMSRHAAEEIWDILGRHLGKLPRNA